MSKDQNNYNEMFLVRQSSIAMKVISAELKLTSFLLEHNTPIAAADHAGPPYRAMFPDSNVASYWMCSNNNYSYH